MSIEGFRENFYKPAKKLCLKNHEIIQKYYPQFLEEFEDSNVFKEILELQETYKLEDEDRKNRKLKQFYKFFDDKTFSLNKDSYNELKKMIENNKTISAKRFSDIVPSLPADSKFLKWLNANKYIK
jgi:hypothetical protein